MTDNRLWFGSDYQEGACDEIMAALGKAQFEHHPGYGTDVYTERAKEKIREACGCPEAQITFFVGGTQTNQVVIDTVCAPYEGVVAAESGHVNVHEAGAIEFSGHKVLTVPSHLGKVDPAEVELLVNRFYEDGNHSHMVYPGMVYVSHPTEYGTLYTKSELQELRRICDAHHMTLFLDGARLAYGLAADESVEGLSLKEIAELTDVFYIGGTKCGALFGEAVVFTKNNEPSHFVTRVKQHGALLAKGFLSGIQFDTLFTDDVYLKNGRNAIKTAMKLKQGLAEKGYRFYLDSPTNQQFVIVETSMLPELDKNVVYGYMEPYDDTHTVIRFCTGWATSEADVDALLEIL